MKYRFLSMAGYLLYTVVHPIAQVYLSLMSYGKLEALRRQGHQIGPGVRLGRHADIHVVGTGRVAIGPGTEIAPYAQLVVEDGATLQIGANCYLSRNLFLGCSKAITIGSNVAIGGYVTIIDVNKRFEDANRGIIGQGHDSIPISIADDVWLGGNVTLLAGASIGTHSVIGACSLVRSEIPAYSVAVGSPARVVRQLEVTA